MRIAQKGTSANLLIILILSAVAIEGAYGQLGFGKSMIRRSTADGDLPNLQACRHDVSKLQLVVRNHGVIGQAGIPLPDCEDYPIVYPPSTYPAGSLKGYLGEIALWIGGIVNSDTLVSVGLSYTPVSGAWDSGIEFYPDIGSQGAIQITTNRIRYNNYSTDAYSDEDMTAEYTDTVTDRRIMLEPMHERFHAPMNLRVEQRSMTWSSEFAEDFALVHLQIENIGNSVIKRAYIGLQVAQGGGYFDTTSADFLDYTGFLSVHRSPLFDEFIDTLNMIWGADNDGDPNTNGEFDSKSPTGASCVRILGTPEGADRMSVNWYTIVFDPNFDYGPMREENKRTFVSGGSGYPMTDREKYYVMSNGEIDPDPASIRTIFRSDNWLPPPSGLGDMLANGRNIIWQLISVGPFDLAPGDSVPFTFAFVCGEDFHRDPTNYERNIIQAYDPDEFYRRLDFDDLVQNAIAAGWVYDNPGYDTDDDGYAGPYMEVVDTLPNGETVIDRYYYAGDGVPDFRAATPPPPPVLRHRTELEQVTLRWNGMITETYEDPFTQNVDFEGYRVYMGRMNRADSYAMLNSKDYHNYSRYKWDYAREKWLGNENPFTLDSLEVLYGEGFDPDEYPFSYEPIGYHDGRNLWCFKPMDWNKSINGWDDGSPWKSDIGIHKVYADEIAAGEVTDEMDIEDTMTSNNWIKDIDPLTGDSIWYHKYWEYEYVVDNLLPSVPWYFSVTAFDFGDAVFGVEPLETSTLANSIEAWAIADEHTVREQNLDVRVYPNPYVGDGRYASAGYEDPYQTGYIDHERRIHFLNLPTECKITIFTISGDVVRELDHPSRHSNTDSKLTWNVRSTNNEIVTSGIYIYVVESRWGKQMGKIVIIL